MFGQILTLSIYNRAHDRDGGSHDRWTHVQVAFEIKKGPLSHPKKEE